MPYLNFDNVITQCLCRMKTIHPVTDSLSSLQVFVTKFTLRSCRLSRPLGRRSLQTSSGNWQLLRCHVSERTLPLPRNSGILYGSETDRTTKDIRHRSVSRIIHYLWLLIKQCKTSEKVYSISNNISPMISSKLDTLTNLIKVKPIS